MTIKFEQSDDWNCAEHYGDKAEMTINALFEDFETYEKTSKIRERLKTIIRQELDTYTNSTMNKTEFAERLVNRLTDKECLLLFKKLIGE